MNSRKIFLIAIFVISLFLRFYKIGYAFPFDYDQEISANTAYNFYKLHKLTLIGQELSFQGFFLGPLHNWLELIPYGFCKLQPNCTPYFFTSIGSAMLIVLYLIISRISDKKVATITTVFFSASFAAISFERIVNSNFFILPTAMLLLFCLYKYFHHNNRYLAIGAFFSGIAVVNFNPIFIFSTIAFFITAMVRKEKSVRIFLLSFFVFAINYLPLAIFNFRHQNLLFNSLRLFLKTNADLPLSIGKIIFIAKEIMLPFFMTFFFQSQNVFLMTLFLVVFSYGLKITIEEKGHSLYLPIWLFTNFVGFIFYKSHVPDYYFLPTLLPMAVLVAKGLQKNKYLLLLFISAFMVANLIKAYLFWTPVNLIIKQKVIDYIENDTKSDSFKLYNEMPFGLNTGYDYLFKLSGYQPTDNGKNLYILSFSNPAQFRMDKFYKTFSSKLINLQTIGYVEIVSIK